jgi:COP9 signalosome complex subunit 3
LAKVSIFLVSFDARQIRYAGKPFASVLDWLTSGDLFPVSDSYTAAALPVANQD